MRAGRSPPRTPSSPLVERLVGQGDLDVVSDPGRVTRLRYGCRDVAVGQHVPQQQRRRKGRLTASGPHVRPDPLILPEPPSGLMTTTPTSLSRASLMSIPVSR